MTKRDLREVRSSVTLAIIVDGKPTALSVGSRRVMDLNDPAAASVLDAYVHPVEEDSSR